MQNHTTKPPRKQIGKKLRFEVFKRDSFTCQYCGEKAPGVVLHVDHIKPVAEGGSGEIFNLITACVDCNLGKGARPLDSQETIVKQHKELSLLQERREQLEMLEEWRRNLFDIEEDEVGIVEKSFTAYTGKSFTEIGVKNTKKLIKKHGLPAVLGALDEACRIYDDDERAFSMVGRIAVVQARAKEIPGYDRVFYIRGILNKRCHYVDQDMALQCMTDCLKVGVPVEIIEKAAKVADEFDGWRSVMTALYNEAQM